MRSFLLTKLRYIGDVLLTTPAIRLLRKSYPDAHITMVVNKGTEDVLRHNPHLNRVLTIDRAKIKNAPLTQVLRHEWNCLKEMRKVRYDVSVDFFSGERAAYLSALCGVPLRIGFQGKRRFGRLLYNKKVRRPDRAHMVQWCLLLLKEGLGLETTDTALELHTAAPDEQYALDWLGRHGLAEREFVALHTGARYARGGWSARNWAQLCDAIQTELGLRAMIVGAASEIAAIREIGSLAKTPVLSAAGQTTVLQLAALLKRAQAFVGVDSGPMHIATAIGTPVVSLFSAASDPSMWGPWGNRDVVIQARLPMGATFRGRTQPNLGNMDREISVREVARAVDQMLQRSHKIRG